MIVAVRGPNGSGKSSIPMSMLDDPDKKIVTKPWHGKQRNIYTVFPTYGWVTLGSYLIKTGGLDQFDNNDMIKKAFWYAIKHYSDKYNILMEGSIASTIYSTYANMFQEALDKYPDLEIQVVSLLPPVEECIKRIYKRNGGKPIKEDLVNEKWKATKRSHKHFLDDGFNAWVWDNTDTTDEKLIHQLEERLEEHRC